MAIKFETVKAGDVLWSVYMTGKAPQRHQMVRKVEVQEVDREGRTAMVSTHGRGNHRVSARDIERYRRSPPKENRPTSPA